MKICVQSFLRMTEGVNHFWLRFLYGSDRRGLKSSFFLYKGHVFFLVPT